MALNPNPNRSFKNNNEIDSRQVMTNKIIQEMNNGTLPWQAPWPKGLVKERQRNPFSETEYKGMNLVTLELAGFGDPRWMTYNQASKNGITIPRGTKGKRIEYWTMKEYTVKENVVDPDTGEISVVEIEKQRPIGKTFTVFNAEQVEGMPPFKNEATKHLPEKELNERAEKLLKATGAQVMFDSPGEAFYDKYTKVIHLSPRYTYNSTYDMYSSILHQLAHWTSSKMDRKIPDITEDKDGYIASDLGVSFLSSDTPKSLLNNEDAYKGYMAGAFLARGSVNNPHSTNYHLEISVEDQGFAKNLSKLLNSFKYCRFTSKVARRRSSYIVYLKRGEQIASFLNLIGAHENCLYFENIRVERDYQNIGNRLLNLESANMGKTVSSSERQLREIEFFQSTEASSYIDSEKLRTLMRIRLSHPDASMAELAVIMSEELSCTISKSNVNHLFRKLHEEYEYRKMQKEIADGQDKD